MQRHPENCGGPELIVFLFTLASGWVKHERITAVIKVLCESR